MHLFTKNAVRNSILVLNFLILVVIRHNYQGFNHTEIWGGGEEGATFLNLWVPKSGFERNQSMLTVFSLLARHKRFFRTSENSWGTFLNLPSIVQKQFRKCIVWCPPGGGGKWKCHRRTSLVPRDLGTLLTVIPNSRGLVLETANQENHRYNHN